MSPHLRAGKPAAPRPSIHPSIHSPIHPPTHRIPSASPHPCIPCLHHRSSPGTGASQAGSRIPSLERLLQGKAALRAPPSHRGPRRAAAPNAAGSIQGCSLKGPLGIQSLDRTTEQPLGQQIPRGGRPSFREGAGMLLLGGVGVYSVFIPCQPAFPDHLRRCPPPGVCLPSMPTPWNKPCPCRGPHQGDPQSRCHVVHPKPSMAKP